MSEQTRKVSFKTRPDLDLHVRALTANQELALQASLAKVETGDVPRIIAIQLSAFVVNADGSPAFPSPDDAIKFMDTVRGGVVTKLVKAGSEFNELTDEAIEEEAKN